MTTNAARSARWLRTFAQILEVDMRHLQPRKQASPRNAKSRMPVVTATRRIEHD
ncbi:hypothetical protein [Thiolapillus sp.]